MELVRNNGGSAVHVVRTYDEAGRACWFLLKANELNLVKLERTAFEDMIDLTQYGEVVASGWGHAPDALMLKNLTDM